MNRNPATELKGMISKERRIFDEIVTLLEYAQTTGDKDERAMISSQINSLKNSLKESNDRIPQLIGKMSLAKSFVPKIKSRRQEIEGTKTASQTSIQPPPQMPVEMGQQIQQDYQQPKKISQFKKEIKLLDLEKDTIKRIKGGRKSIKKKKLKKPSMYVKTASKIFSRTSMKLANKKMFSEMRKDLVRADLQFIPANYISMILLTTLLASVGGVFIFLFFLFFNISATLPIIIPISEPIAVRLLKVFWIIFAVPVGTFLLMYFYPSMEKKAVESDINRELPFATINMAAISGSMIEPSKIFDIIIMTGEYPALEKKFIKLMNEVNVYGYDLASALKNMASNNPGTKLSELFNGIATTITSGGNLPEFFNKRSQSLLFEHKLEREKQTRAAETFMDIYISVVIAAPMILMILLMMMKIGGFGVSLSTGMITTIIILSVGVVNIFFLAFLQIKQPK